MSDLKKTDELDSYGVWVKTPPKTMDSSESTETKKDDIFNLDRDLPDFSDLDVIDESLSSDYDNEDSSLSAEELSAIEGVTSNTEEQSSSIPQEQEPSNSEEEISLDEFIEGGIFETGPDEDKIKEKHATSASTPSPVEQEESEVKEDDEEFTISTDSSEEELVADFSSEENVSDDELFNVDLSFDDEETSQTQETEVLTPSFEAPSDSPEGTEDVDLSEFGFDDLNDDEGVQEDTEASSMPDGTEEVNLSEFGFDDTEEETATKSDLTVETVEQPELTEDDSQIKEEVEDVTISLDEATNEETDDFSVIAEEDEKKVEADTVSNVSPTTGFSPDGDDDFDVDSILGDVKDENGNTVSIGKQEDNLVKAVDDVPSEFIEETEVVSEEIPDFTGEEEIEPDEEIPDTFDEETASFLDDDEVVEQDEFGEVPIETELSAQTEYSNDNEDTQAFADSIKAPILDEKDMEESVPSSQMTALFSQIVGELSSLKNDIASLKNEFENLKTTKEPEPILETEEPFEDEGFFDATDEDETIALSTDELDNILNSADITQAAENQEPLKLDDFDTHEEHIEETEHEEQEIELTEENILGNVDSDIEIPEEDFDEENGLSMDFSPVEENIDEPLLENIDYTSGTEDTQQPEEIRVPKADDILVDSSSTDFMNESEVSQLTEENTAQIENNPFDEFTREDPPITETLTEEKLDYLSETPTPEEGLSENPISSDLKTEIKSVLSYMDQLLENLPEEKIAEFAQSEQFETYKKLFKELGLS